MPMDEQNPKAAPIDGTQNVQMEHIQDALTRVKGSLKGLRIVTV